MNLHFVIGTDYKVFQYNFTNFTAPFSQEKDTIYWLDVQAMPLDPAGQFDDSKKFGWKTTIPSLGFNDAAVFGDTTSFGGIPPTWGPMSYPTGHPYEMQPVNMAFVITPEPGTVAMLVGAGLMGLGLLVRRRWRK